MNSLQQAHAAPALRAVGTQGPQAPVPAAADRSRPSDPSSARASAGRYPIPAFFEYRERSRSRDFL